MPMPMPMPKSSVFGFSLCIILAALVVGGLLGGGIHLILTRESRSRVYGEQIAVSCSDLSCRRVRNHATFCSYECVGNITYTFNGTRYYVLEYYEEVVQKPTVGQSKAIYLNSKGKIVPKEDENVLGAVILFTFGSIAAILFILVGLSIGAAMLGRHDRIITRTSYRNYDISAPRAAPTLRAPRPRSNSTPISKPYPHIRTRAQSTPPQRAAKANLDLDWDWYLVS
jgi:hypothetical protein